MRDTRVGRVALVVVVDRFTSVGEEDGVAVVAAPLQYADRKVLLGDGVRMPIGIVFSAWPIEGVDLLAQHGAFQRPAGFTLFLDCQPGGQDGVVEEVLAGFN